MSKSPRAGRGRGIADDANTGGRDKISRFFSIAEVAELLSVSTRTVRRWIEKKLLASHVVGAIVRIGEGDLQAFLASHRR